MASSNELLARDKPNGWSQKVALDSTRSTGRSLERIGFSLSDGLARMTRVRVSVVSLVYVYVGGVDVDD